MLTVYVYGNLSKMKVVIKILVLVYLSLTVACKPVKPQLHTASRALKYQGKSQNNAVLAIIGTHRVTYMDVKRIRNELPVVQRLMFSGKKGLRKLVESYIELLVMAMEGVKAGLSRDPLVMEAIRGYLALHYIEKQVNIKHIKFSEKQLKNYYEEHERLFHIPERHLCLDIFAKDEKRINEIYERLSTAMNELLNKEPEEIFKDFVKRYSESPQKSKNNGSTGFLPPLYANENHVAPEVIKKAVEMKVLFSVSKPFKAADGYHILFLDKINPAVDMDFTSARPRIENLMREAINTKKRREVIKKLISQAKIRINEKVLNEIK